MTNRRQFLGFGAAATVALLTGCTGGAGKDAYVFHSTSGLLTLEDFSLAKGDTLTIDKSLQGSLHETSDGIGGVILSFGTAGHGVDIHGLSALPSSNIAWA